MRKNFSGRTAHQLDSTYWLQRSNLKSAQAGRLKMGLREVCAQAHNDHSAPASI
jgi:hypothetical protein